MIVEGGGSERPGPVFYVSPVSKQKNCSLAPDKPEAPVTAAKNFL